MTALAATAEQLGPRSGGGVSCRDRRRGSSARCSKHASRSTTAERTAGRVSGGPSGLSPLARWDGTTYGHSLGARFLTVDPAVAATRDPYGYASGNPANLVDPLGLYSLDSLEHWATQGYLPVDPMTVLAPADAVEQLGTGALQPTAAMVDHLGYVPEMTENADGAPRMFNPGGECSWKKDTGLTYDFQQECKTHDYLYDLRRHVGVPLSRYETDSFFYNDLQCDCDGRFLTHEGICRGHALEMINAVRLLGS